MTASNTTAPLYVQFAQALRIAIQAEGLPAPETHDTPSSFHENAGYFFVQWGPHGQSPALIIPKSVIRMGNLHSHIDLSGLPGHIALPKRNGRVACHFTPDIALVSRALHLFVGASKRPVAPPVRRLVAPLPVASPAPVVPLTDMFPGLASQAPTPDYSDDDAQEALQALNA